MKITVENHLRKQIEVELRFVSHSDRKNWIKEVSKLHVKPKRDSNETESNYQIRVEEKEQAAILLFLDFREKFLKDHLTEKSIDLDTLPSESVDTMLKELEKKMDFTTGLSSKLSNTQLEKKQS